MERLTIIKRIRSDDRLLSLPQVLSEILQEAGRDDFSPDSLARIILKDPSLTARILKMANSPFYHRLSEIKTVNQAVSVMGVTTVKCLALSSSVLRPERIVKTSGVDPRKLFSHVLSVASASEAIAQAVHFKAVEEAFIAGLLHDVGVLFFIHHYPDVYRDIVNKKVRASSLIEAERQVFGIDHAEVGMHLAEVWRLPDYMGRAIAGHHSVATEDRADLLQRIVGLATLLAGDRFSGWETGLEERLRAVKRLSSQLSLEKEKVDEISTSLLSRTVEVAEYLGVDIGNVEDILVQANQEIWRSYLTMENLFKERQELSASLLKEERAKGAAEAKAIAMATLSHYLNNATMAIYGRSQLIRMMLKKGSHERLIEKLPNDLEILDHSIAKIVAVLEEMREISPIDENQFYNLSRGLNIDDKLEKRLAKMRQSGTWEAVVETAPTD
jgi:putative nucleotidyltransferase with HDIG domain